MPYRKISFPSDAILLDVSFDSILALGVIPRYYRHTDILLAIIFGSPFW